MENPLDDLPQDPITGSETQIEILQSRLKDVKKEIQERNTIHQKNREEAKDDLKDYTEWIDNQLIKTEKEKRQLYRELYEKKRRELRDQRRSRFEHLLDLRKEKRDLEQEIKEIKNSAI